VQGIKYEEIRSRGSIRSHSLCIRAGWRWQILCGSLPRLPGILVDNLQLYANYERGCTAFGPFPVAAHNQQVGLNSSKHPLKSERTLRLGALAHDVHAAKASATWVRR
jgi:hypothetical protein